MNETNPMQPAARRTDPETSHLAAAQVTNAGHDRIRALRHIDAAGQEGLTDFELAELTGRQQTSIGKRRGELVAIGLVIDSGRRRPAPSGRAAIVWTIAPDPTTDQEPNQ